MNLPERYNSRRLWLNFHLILALTAGLIFALLGLTGSISIYREELDEWLNPELVIAYPQTEYQSLDKIMAAARAAHPDRHGEWTLEMPGSPHGMMTAWFEKPRETYFERYAPLMVSVNPYTAEVVASRFWGQTFTTWLSDLHTQLLMGDRGWNIVGWCGLLLPFSVVSGLYLWWPGVRRLPSALKIRCQSGLMYLLLDLHRMMGVFFAPVLVLLAITGSNLSFPSWLENLAGSSGMAHGSTGKVITSTAHPNDHPTQLEVAEFIARGPFHDAEIRRITTPDGETGVYRVNLRQKFEINQRHPYTTVWVDRWSSQIREVRNPAAFGIGENLITWIWPLHTGEAVGKFGRLCWFLAGQSLFFLYISGLYHWLCRTGKIEDRVISQKVFSLSINARRSFTQQATQARDYLRRKLSGIDEFNRIRQYLNQFATNFLRQVTYLKPNAQAKLKHRLLPLAQDFAYQIRNITRRCFAYAKVKFYSK
jgi:uncharacterized iron-regulated membrane protein